MVVAEPGEPVAFGRARPVVVDAKPGAVAAVVVDAKPGAVGRANPAVVDAEPVAVVVVAAEPVVVEVV